MTAEDIIEIIQGDKRKAFYKELTDKDLTEEIIEELASWVIAARLGREARNKAVNDLETDSSRRREWIRTREEIEILRAFESNVYFVVGAKSDYSAEARFHSIVSRLYEGCSQAKTHKINLKG